MCVHVRLLHLARKPLPSFRNSRGISRSSFAWSILAEVAVRVISSCVVDGRLYNGGSKFVVCGWSR